MCIFDTVKILYAVEKSVRVALDRVEELGFEEASFLQIWLPLFFYFINDFFYYCDFFTSYLRALGVLPLVSHRFLEAFKYYRNNKDHSLTKWHRQYCDNA